MDSTRRHATVVVGVDGSPTTAGVLHWGLRHAVLAGADVEVVACWQWPSTAGGFAPFPDLDLSGPTLAAAESAVASAVASTPGAEALAVKTRVVEGYASRVLVDAALGADLLVVGSRGHGELHGLVLGSVGLHCASHAPCPVVVVRGTDPTD